MAGAHAKPAARRKQPSAPAKPGGTASESKLADVARGSTLNLLGAAFSGGATVAVTVLVTRHFSKPVAGAFFTAISLFLIAEAAASLGGYVGLVNFIAALRRIGSENKVAGVLRAAVIPVTVVSVAAGAAMIAGAGPLARLVLAGHFGHAGARTDVVTAALRALGAALPFAALLDTLLGASRGYRSMRSTVVVDRIGRSALQLAGIAVAVVSGTAALLAPLWALPYVPAAVCAWLWLRRLRQRARAAPPTQAPDTPAGQRRAAVLASRQLAQANAGGFWRFTAPRAAASLAQITIQRLDIVLVAILRGPAEAAIYTAATRFLVAGQFANAAISLAAQPRFAELFAVGDRRGAGEVYQATTAWLILLTWPLYLLAMIFGPEVLTVFGHSYRAGGTVMIILGCAMLVATACGQVDMVLIATGRSSWSLANGLLAVAVNVTLDLLLIPHYGIAGAAFGWGAAIALTNLVPLAQLALAARVHPFGRAMLAAGVLPALGLGLLPLAARAAFPHDAAAAVTAVALGAAFVAAGSWRLRGPLRLSELPGLSALARPPGARKPGSPRLASQKR